MSENQDVQNAAKVINGYVDNALKVEEYISRRDELEKLDKESNAKEMITFINARYQSGEISYPDYVFRTSFYVKSLHEDRWFNQKYDSELKPISKKLRAIEEESGLEENEYWGRNEGPENWQELNKEYDKVLEIKLLSVFEELNLEEVSNLYGNDRIEYDRLYEAGRTNIFNPKTEIEKLSNIVDKFKKEARTSFENEAYFATAILSGAAIEALLLKEVLKRSEEVDKLIKSWPPKKKLKSDPKRWVLDTLIVFAEKANWLPRIEIEGQVFHLETLAHVVRKFRNYLHPGVILREKQTIEVEKSEAEFANSILILLDYVIDYLDKDNPEV